MNVHAKVKNTLLIGTVALGLLGLYGFVQADDTAPMEKCYGISKAGLNDCEPSANSVTCDKSVVDADPNYWIYLPKGTCDRIVGGMTSMTATGTTAPSSTTPDLMAPVSATTTPSTATPDATMPSTGTTTTPTTPTTTPDTTKTPTTAK